MQVLPPILVLVLIAAMLALRVLAPGALLISFPHNLAGVLVSAAGLLITAAGAGQFSRARTNIRTLDEPGTPITDGLFRWSRNPMYLGFFLLLLGMAILLRAATPFLAVLLFVIVADRWYVAFEEPVMLRKFGKHYEAYMRSTRRWI